MSLVPFALSQTALCTVRGCVFGAPCLSAQHHAEGIPCKCCVSEKTYVWRASIIIKFPDTTLGGTPIVQGTCPSLTDLHGDVSPHLVHRPLAGTRTAMPSPYRFLFNVFGAQNMQSIENVSFTTHEMYWLWKKRLPLLPTCLSAVHMNSQFGMQRKVPASFCNQIAPDNNSPFFDVRHEKD